MNTRSIIKLILYGIVLWILLNITIFVASLIYGINKSAEMSAPPPLGFVLVAIVMAVLSSIFTRLMQLDKRKFAIIAGLIWSGMMFAFMLVLTVANGTQANIFGNWGAYFALIAPAVGSIFVKERNASVGDASSTT